jgi:hypothetical protein
MRITDAFASVLLAVACLLLLALPALAAINAYGLGASFDSTQSSQLLPSAPHLPVTLSFIHSFIHSSNNSVYSSGGGAP